MVTGGGSGIGRALALALAGAGCDVAVADIDADGAVAVAAEVRRHGVRAIAARTDVTNDADLAALAERTVDELGDAHVICANAGVLLQGSVLDMNLQDWEWLYGINVFGVARTIYAFLPYLRAQGDGHLAITASVNSIAGAGLYGSSKAALLHLAETLHAELAPEGIGVTVNLPAQISSRITSSQRNRPASFGRKVDEPMAHVTDFGIDPSHVGRLTVDAIQAGQLYVPVFPDGQQQRYTAPLKARLDALHEAVNRGSVRP
ncbi:MAG: short-chain dehydrogenase [Actinomycetia bacterium]|nr:short-chain dehydrogenase [Actinomycetes bacterium]